jgi:hypothetical protein
MTHGRMTDAVMDTIGVDQIIFLDAAGPGRERAAAEPSIEDVTGGEDAAYLDQLGVCSDDMNTKAGAVNGPAGAKAVAGDLGTAADRNLRHGSDNMGALSANWRTRMEGRAIHRCCCDAP